MKLTRLAYIFSALCLTVACGPGNKPGPDTPVDERYLNFDQTQIRIGYEETSFSIRVETNFDYEVSVLCDWIHVDDRMLYDVAFNYFLADENEAGSPREAQIRFADRNDRYYVKFVTVTQDANGRAKIAVPIVDKDATDQTKALLANLLAITDKGWMFGHHDDLWYGRYWYNERGASDTKSVCGDYPAVFSVDFAEIMDNRYASSANAIRRRVILEARERGDVIIACAHLNNPLTGGDSWDNSSDKVVSEILTTGSATRTKYLGWLDRLADFANNLKDSNGDLVPVILRIYHEHTQSWSWWGSKCTTASDFVALWQMTVRYLRDTRGVHNLLYAVSPQMDAVYPDGRDRILYRWPGDEWVDFIGMDCYHGTWDDAFKANMDVLTTVAGAKTKPCGVTETGQESFSQQDFWTRHILEPVGNRKISMVVMWRNKYVGSDESDRHYFSVYPGHPSEADFRTMYADPRSLFSADLPDMYTMPKGYEIK